MLLGRRNSYAFFVFALCGCSTFPESLPWEPSGAGAEAGPRYAEYAGNPSLEDLHSQLAALKQTSGWSSRGYLTPDEHNELERLYAAYLRRRRFLREAVAWAENSDEVDEDAYASSIVRRFCAEQIDGDSRLIATFADDKIAVRKLNEAFYRSGIGRGSFDQLWLEVTDPATQASVLSSPSSSSSFASSNLPKLLSGSDAASNTLFRLVLARLYKLRVVFQL